MMKEYALRGTERLILGPSQIENAYPSQPLPHDH